MIIALNGTWEIADSIDNAAPVRFDRQVPVPGLAKLAQPAFPGLRVAEIGWLPLKVRQRARPDPRRNYFWYRRRFHADRRAPLALLRFAKAQFGLEVWLNGTSLGEDYACFSTATFDATTALRVGENELLVRVGAHPLVLPPDVPCGSDHEKYLWTAGLYDEVELTLAASTVMASVQVAPDVAHGLVRIELTARNHGDQPATWQPALTVRQDRDSAVAATSQPPPQILAPAAVSVTEHTLALAGAHRWSPDDPFLYRLHVDGAGSPVTVRFGLREFRFDNATRRAWLNGEPCYLRGTNITLHRFFEDEACGTLPWDEAWIRRLLLELPRRYHWNCMRWSIGTPPRKWLEIADEAGLLVEYEFPLWTWRDEWSHATTQAHVARWMADAWNHPSVAWWSLSNETHHAPLIGMVGELRKLDCSARGWSNGYNLPEGEDDPVDDHPYKWHAPVAWPHELWDNAKYAAGTGETTSNAPHPSAHPAVANEYCWFWLRRDGTPTDLTRDMYQRYLPDTATPDERRALYAYYLAAETEYFRAHRKFAGVLHFVYLTCDHPWSLTGDLFRDVVRLDVQPVYDAALCDAFAPLGVYLNYWADREEPGAPLVLHAMLVNDESVVCDGALEFRLERSDGRVLDRATVSFHLPVLGAHTYRCAALAAPAEPGDYLLAAAATPTGGATVTSRRKLSAGLPLTRSTEVVPA